MKKVILKTLPIFAIFCLSFTSNAQFFKKLKKKIEDKTNDAIEQQIDGNPTNKASNKLKLGEEFDFKAGDSIIYASNFLADKTGAMPHDWKTNGSGSIVTANGISGKWLKMEAYTSYKLKQNLHYPKNFTVEFDLIAVADQVKDLSGLYFGFCKDNSVRDWISTDNIWNTELLYMNNHEIVVSSSATDKYLSTDFDLEPYANQVMHVSIEVHQNHVKVYLGNTKIADTDLFRDEIAQHFFVSAPLNEDHGASVLFSNFVIKTYK
ncbi:hypothetical protein ACG2LH_06565 [Zhouia sp. PK063]|uniref:hypothetical protein n=1 Tax=Zhouia sp. PK063 TaxID=3373602 RepID=UPI00378BF664